MTVLRIKAPKTCHIKSNGALVMYSDYAELEQKFKSLEPEWKSPETTPTVKIGEELLFWVAVEVNKINPHPQPKLVEKRIVTFLAYYQNRPLSEIDDTDDMPDWTLSDECGGYVGSIGWVDNKAHHDFEDFYEPLDFNEHYKLVGWAEHTPPLFTGIK